MMPNTKDPNWFTKRREEHTKLWTHIIQSAIRIAKEKEGMKETEESSINNQRHKNPDTTCPENPKQNKYYNKYIEYI